jgi:hypothetical protein
MIGFDDIDDIDEAARLEQLKSQLHNEIRELSARIVFPPPIRTAVAIGSIAGHYFGALPGIAGAILGFKVHQNRKLSALDKHIIVAKINAKRKQLEQLERVTPGDGQSIDGIMSSSDLINYDYEKLNFTGRWAKFIGQPQVGFHAMVFGIPKSGKSILCTQFAKYLADNFGSVLYVAAEEGFSMTLQNKLREFGQVSENLHYANFRDFESIKNALAQNHFNFVFLDSVNFMKIEPDQLRQLKQLNPGVSFITIQQATKDGKFRGSQEYAHDADVIINVAGGVAQQQGRFHEPSVMRVFKKGTYNPDPEEIDDDEDDEDAPENNGAGQIMLNDGIGMGY